MDIELPESIKTYDEAYAFMLLLHNNGIAFHPDDDAHDIVDREGNNTFTKAQADKINELMEQCFNTPLDPSGLAVNIFHNSWIKRALLLCKEHVKDVYVLGDIDDCLGWLEEINPA